MISWQTWNTFSESTNNPKFYKMKKLFFFLFFFSLTSIFAQDAKVVYLRATIGSMGVRDDEFSGVKEWIINGREINILIELHQTKVIIHSKEQQSYHVINQVENIPTSSKWLCKDKEGKSCYIALKTDPEYPGLVNVAIEYNDMVWFYICTQD
jgi:hypothetical protein